MCCLATNGETSRLQLDHLRGDSIGAEVSVTSPLNTQYADDATDEDGNTQHS